MIVSLSNFEIKICTKYKKDLNEYKSQIFSEMVKLAIKHLQHFHSDLFWDALWLDRVDLENLENASFVYCIGTSGTSVLLSDKLSRDISIYRPFQYKFAFRPDHVEITKFD